MKRITVEERADWRKTAERLGFVFHHSDGARYWDERAYYHFSLDEIEREIEGPTAELHALCLDLVKEVVASDTLMERIAIPPAMRDLVAASWRVSAPSLYGRFDFAYDGTGPAKLLEYNADTPTSIYETALFQWQWFEEQLERGVLPSGADQYNRLHEALIERFAAILTPGSLLHFSGVADHVEDRQTLRYLEDLARQAKLDPHFVAIDAIGVDGDGQFVDDASTLIAAAFKLYPWEDLLREPYAVHLSTARTLWLEPAWKAVLSNKAMLALLWERHPGHPNLLPTVIEGSPRSSDAVGDAYVRKPFFSREGWDIEIVDRGERTAGPIGGYGQEGHVLQALSPLFEDDGHHAVLGSWIVGETPVALSVREDDGPITRDTARFLPHVIS